VIWNHLLIESNLSLSGGETPVHDYEEVIVIIRGSGQIFIKGKITEFGPNHTLIIPTEVVHQLINCGNEDIFLIAAFSSTPAKVFTSDGKELPLPWQS
jgi:mannose-6-phosphate isomerase-like protein (cupin superfamily)